MKDTANSPAFIITNIAYALAWCAAIGLILPKGVSLYVLLIPFFWFIHTRATTRRIEELREVTDMNTELLIAVLRKDPNFDIEDFLEEEEYDDET